MAATFDPCVLHRWRLETGLTLEQACVLAQVSYPYLRALESGAHRNPSAGLLSRLAAVYGDRAIGELFTDSDQAGIR
jgi:transcriptional regulator with XRE-family HTH domain